MNKGTFPTAQGNITSQFLLVYTVQWGTFVDGLEPITVNHISGGLGFNLHKFYWGIAI